MDRYHVIAKCMDIWMNLREKNHSINKYFLLRKIQKIGIYGYGILGRHLIWEIEQSGGIVKVEWILDKRADSITTSHYPVYQPDRIADINKPELIVVCAINDFEEIEAFISERIRVPIIALDTIVKECNRKAQEEYNV